MDKDDLIFRAALLQCGVKNQVYACSTTARRMVLKRVEELEKAYEELGSDEKKKEGLLTLYKYLRENGA